MESIAYSVRQFNSVISRPKMVKGKYPHVQALRTSRYRAALGCVVALIVLLLLVLTAARIVRPTEVVNSSIRRDALEERGKQWIEILSWEPRAVLYHNFLDRGQDKIVQDIERRIALFSHIPVEHGEGLQVLWYEFGQKQEPHVDYFNDTINTKNGGERTATMLMYLSDVEEGGETVFPAANANFSAVPWWDELSECGKMGNAVLFWSTKPDGSVDPASLHGSCPVIKGDKWSAPKWMHLRKYKVKNFN